MAPPGFWGCLEGQRGNVTTVNHTGLIHLFLVLRCGRGARCLRSQAGLRLPRRCRAAFAGLCSSPGVGAGVPGRGLSSFVGSRYLCVLLRRTGGQGAGFGWPCHPPSPFPVLGSWPVRAELAHLSVTLSAPFPTGAQPLVTGLVPSPLLAPSLGFRTLVSPTRRSHPALLPRTPVHWSFRARQSMRVTPRRGGEQEQGPQHSAPSPGSSTRSFPRTPPKPGVPSPHNPPGNADVPGHSLSCRDLLTDEAWIRLGKNSTMA